MILSCFPPVTCALCFAPCLFYSVCTWLFKRATHPVSPSHLCITRYFAFLCCSFSHLFLSTLPPFFWTWISPPFLLLPPFSFSLCFLFFSHFLIFHMEFASVQTTCSPILQQYADQTLLYSNTFLSRFSTHSYHHHQQLFQSAIEITMHVIIGLVTRVFLFNNEKKNMIVHCTNILI